MFSGSYDKADVTFLLKRLPNVQQLDVHEKEAHIQNGGHYSEVLSPEKAPEPQYLELFQQQLEATKARLAQDVLRLAKHIAQKAPATEALALVSLARAGTPVGVLVKRALEHHFGLTVKHYSVSIIRDRGLDLNALRMVRIKHPCDEAIFFLDGWTGKGVIGEELTRSVQAFNRDHGLNISPDLHVLADIAGTAAVCATRADYLLPSAILNATVSGLISRTVLTKDIGPHDFHGCAYLDHLEPADQTKFFIETVWAVMAETPAPEDSALCNKVSSTADAYAGRLERPIHALVEELKLEFNLSDRNFVKPGVGESTRVMLRRVPRLLLVQKMADPEVRHLLHLAAEKCVEVVERPTLPCKSVALIEQFD